MANNNARLLMILPVDGFLDEHSGEPTIIVFTHGAVLPFDPQNNLTFMSGRNTFTIPTEAQCVFDADQNVWKIFFPKNWYVQDFTGDETLDEIFAVLDACGWFVDDRLFLTPDDFTRVFGSKNDSVETTITAVEGGLEVDQAIARAHAMVRDSDSTS